jgi:hypothetical protein
MTNNGFEIVDEPPPSFKLAALKFNKGSESPHFPKNLNRRFNKYGKGLTVLRTDQCPYLDQSVLELREIANEKNLSFKEIELTTARQVRATAPSAFGVYNIVYNGKLLSYHPLDRKQMRKRLDEAGGPPRVEERGKGERIKGIGPLGKRAASI